MVAKWRILDPTERPIEGDQYQSDRGDWRHIVANWLYPINYYFRITEFKVRTRRRRTNGKTD